MRIEAVREEARVTMLTLMRFESAMVPSIGTARATSQESGGAQ